MTSLPVRTRDGHVAALDSIRALAVMAVVFSHSVPEDWSWMPLNLGRAGVTVFFVLSGFLITGILLEARAAAEQVSASKVMVLRRFYVRRALRILPLFYCVLLILRLAAPADMHDSLPWHLLYASNYYNAVHGAWLGPASHFWSLAVEEQFYLVWPVVLLLSKRALLPAFITLGILVGPISRWLGLLLIQNDVSAYTLTTSCVDSLAAGALLAYLRRPGGPLAHASGVLGDRLAAAALLAYLVIQAVSRRAAQPDIDIIWADLAVGMCAFGVIQAIVARRSRRIPVLSSPVLSYIGTISYGVYVWHYPVPWLAWSLRQATGYDVSLPLPGWSRFFIVLGVTLVAASGSWHFLERPFNRLKARFPYVPPARRAHVEGIS
jgi:peptidoglycan/LPS O-acetylase OafA/YrhL